MNTDFSHTSPSDKISSDGNNSDVSASVEDTFVVSIDAHQNGSKVSQPVLGRLHITDFSRRHMKPEPHPYAVCQLPDEKLIETIRANFHLGTKGYRDGVLLVPVPPEGFLSSLIPLQEGDTFTGRYKARRAGETPRKSYVKEGASKAPALSCKIVLYRADVLAEDGENTLPSSVENWEVVSINASPTEDETPIHPDTLMYNHFHLSGGTATKMSDAEFVEQLRRSFIYHSQMVMAIPSVDP